MSDEEMMPLTERQRGSLLVATSGRRPGWIMSTGNTSLRALERRGLVTSRPDPSAPGMSIWNGTAAGFAWVAADRAKYR